MITALKKFFGIVSTKDLNDFKSQGAIILDVRTPSEFKQGNITGSMNIPVDQLMSSLKKLNQQKPIITCCASGMRSGRAADLLRAKGFQVLNGGSWGSLQYKLK